MLKSLKIASLALCVMLGITTASAFGAPTSIVIGSGAASGTYNPVVEEIKRFCDSEIIGISHYADPATGDTGGGSVANLRRILNNLATAGLVQADVAYLEKSSNPAMARVLALLPLHTEQIHVIVPSNVSVLIKEGSDGVLGFGQSDPEYEIQSNPITTIGDLAGKRIAAWGGSVTTAKVVDQLGNVRFSEIVDAKDQKSAFTLLDSGQVEGVLAVTGAPTAWVAELSKGSYKLLVAGKSLEEAVSDVYGTSGISYDNMGATGQQLSALSVDALLMTRTYRTPDMLNALAALQQCVKDKIFEIQDTPGTHPAWQTIDPSREMKWDNVFTAPGSSATTSATVVPAN